jgi:hypothetical protein
VYVSSSNRDNFLQYLLVQAFSESIILVCMNPVVEEEQNAVKDAENLPILKKFS